MVREEGDGFWSFCCNSGQVRKIFQASSLPGTNNQKVFDGLWVTSLFFFIGLSVWDFLVTTCNCSTDTVSVFYQSTNTLSHCTLLKQSSVSIPALLLPHRHQKNAVTQVLYQVQRKKKLMRKFLFLHILSYSCKL